MTTVEVEVEDPQCHKDGTVSYWCPRRARTVHGATTSIPLDAQALMSEQELARVRRHVWRHWRVYL